MAKMASKRLLKDQRVMEEINKHKWIESEKAGYDIGFDKAAEDWVSRYADEWEDRHLEKTFKRNKKVRKKSFASDD